MRETMKGREMRVEHARPGSPLRCVPTNARSQARQQLRRFAELRSISHGLLGERPTRAEMDLEASPLEVAVGREAVRLYEFALGGLAPRDREAVLGRIELQWPYKQLAAALGTATSRAARTLVIRAVSRLLEAMSR
jgi:DNA-directed RNA polymerase specialized sigma24 family protein